LPYRALGTPVRIPNGREKVSQIPQEWMHIGNRTKL
jgi:hypothetical protein